MMIIVSLFTAQVRDSLNFVKCLFFLTQILALSVFQLHFYSLAMSNIVFLDDQSVILPSFYIKIV